MRPTLAAHRCCHRRANFTHTARKVRFFPTALHCEGIQRECASTTANQTSSHIALDSGVSCRASGHFTQRIGVSGLICTRLRWRNNRTFHTNFFCVWLEFIIVEYVEFLSPTYSRIGKPPVGHMNAQNASIISLSLCGCVVPVSRHHHLSDAHSSGRTITICGILRHGREP